MCIRDRAQAGQLRLAGHVFESSREGIIVTDPHTRILAVNPAFTQITGYTAAEVLGQTPAFLASGDHDADFYNAMWKSIRETGSWTGEIRNRRAGHPGLIIIDQRVVRIAPRRQCSPFLALQVHHLAQRRRGA